MVNSVAILTKTGRLLIARQFVHQDHSQIEGQLAAFPQLVANSTHAYIDIETVRFVYQEVSDLYIVIITPKDSNIIDDLEVLNLFIDVTRSIAGDLTEESITPEKGLDLIMAYDEIVFDGVIRKVNSSDVKKFLKMESKEEDDYLRQYQQKVEEARRVREALAKKNHQTGAYSSESFASQPAFIQTEFDPSNVPSTPSYAKPTPQTQPRRGGLQLTKNVGGSKMRAKQLLAEEALDIPEELNTKPKETIKGLTVTISEVVEASVSRVGKVREVSLSGNLTAVSPRRENVRLSIKGPREGVRAKAMMQSDRSLFRKENALIYDSAGGKCPEGKEVTLLSWVSSSEDPEDLPVAVSVWPAASGGSATLTAEVDTKKSLDSVLLVIPFAGKASISSSDGDANINDGVVEWHADISSGHAELELTADCNIDSFFPVSVEFEGRESLAGVAVEGTEGPDGEPVQCDIRVVTRSGRFEID